MKFVNVLSSLALLACGAQATWQEWHGCLSDAEAQSIVDRSIIFLQHKDINLANQTAQALFADNIVEFGDSINSLRGDPLGTQVENGKATYIEETLSTPVIPSITTISIVKDCRRFVWQWQFDGIGSGQYRVRGVTFITVNDQGKVSDQYVEFNSLAWGLDLGFQVTVPPNAFGPGTRR